MIEVRKLLDIEDFEKLAAIQRSAWEFNDMDIEPHFLMTRVQKYGGLVQGAFLDGRMVGFSYAVIGRKGGEYFLYSHMAAVLKEFQGRGFGFLLKCGQRDEALKMGYPLIKWSFDPLEALNVYFNIHLLGVISFEYERNVYGMGRKGIHQGLETDRLVATWELESQRVRDRIEKKPDRIFADPASLGLGSQDGPVIHIEIPADIRKIKSQHPREALRIQNELRRCIEGAFDSGYTARETVFSEDERRLFVRLLLEDNLEKKHST